MKKIETKEMAQIVFLITILLACFECRGQASEFNTYTVCNIPDHHSEFIKDDTWVYIDDELVWVRNDTYDFRDEIIKTDTLSNTAIEYYTRSDKFIKKGVKDYTYQIKWVSHVGDIVTFFNTNKVK